MSNFEALALHPQLLKSIESLGFTEPTEVQARAVPVAMEGKDLLVTAKTGSGKTAAFLLPVLHRLLTVEAPNSGTRALVLVPTRELALQSQKMFQALARFTQIRCGVVIGGEPYKYQVATLRRNPEVLIATPGRLVEHLEKRSLDFNDLEVLIMDEADRMLDMGFADDMQKIAGAARTERQNLLFSATLKHKGMNQILGILETPVSLQIDDFQQDHSHIHQQIVLADDMAHKYRLVGGLIAEEQVQKSIVFCRTRSQCEEVGKNLAKGELRVGFIHGEIPQSERKQVLNRFRDNKLQVLVATDVAARGLDIPDVDLVINFTVAHSGDEHVHRVGRTGRAGKTGKAVTLVDSFEWNKMSSIERYLKIRFEHRIVAGMKAAYQGPKQLKKSGKAVGKRVKPAQRDQKRGQAKKRVNKDKGKRRTTEPSKKFGQVQDQRFGAMKRRPGSEDDGAK